MTLQTISIADAQSGASARVLPGRGFNCYSFQVSFKSQPLEALWAVKDFETGQGKASGSGIPLMLPFAGRLRETSFRYQGRQYQLEAGDGQGNAIHGFVIDRPWRVTDQAADRVRGEFHASRDEPKLLEHWPSDFRIVAEYRVAGNSLITDYAIDNPGTGPLPFGFGTHPYFRVPLGGADSKNCNVTVPVSAQWELEKLLPTGRKSVSQAATDLARGMAFPTMQLDSVFDGVRFDNHRAQATVDDTQSKCRLTMTFDDQFPAVVVYNPPHREAVCIEPYTTIPDAFALGEQGVETYLRILPPGKSFATRIEISVNG